MKVQQTCQARPILLVDVRWAERRIGAPFAPPMNLPRQKQRSL